MILKQLKLTYLGSLPPVTVPNTDGFAGIRSPKRKKNVKS